MFVSPPDMKQSDMLLWITDVLVLYVFIFSCAQALYLFAHCSTVEVCLCVCVSVEQVFCVPEWWCDDGDSLLIFVYMRVKEREGQREREMGGGD